MDHEQWVDITGEIFAIKKQFKLLQVIKDNDISLEDCMQAQQINDDKMDPKFDICHQHTIAYLLKNNIVKLPDQLKYDDILVVFCNVIQLQASMLRGQPPTSTIYSFSYLYDSSIYQNHYLMKPLVESVNFFGNYLYELVKSSCSVKEDDINMLAFSFNQQHESNENIIELLLQAEKKLQAEQKTNKQSKDQIKALVSMFRFRRFLHFFMKSLGKQFDPKNINKIKSDFQSVQKRLAAVEDLKIEQKQLLDGVFFNYIYKTLRCHFGPKDSKIRSFQESLEDFKNIFSQLEMFLPVPSKIHDFKNRVEMLEGKPYNALAKSFLKVNIFAKQQHILSSIKTEEALIEDINDWTHLKDSLKIDEKFVKLISSGAPVVSQTLYRLLGNSMRWFWECSKIYEDFNIVIHLANQVDTQIATGNRQMYICSWFYYYGLNLLIKQLLVGFQINIYQPNEALYTVYVLQNFLNIFERNSLIHLRKIDKTFLNNYLEGNFTKKLKKKMTQNSKRMFADIQFKKGLQLYFKALFRIIAILRQRNLIPNPFQDSEQLRIKQRFRIFKHVMFTKVIEYQEYKKLIEEINENATEVLTNTIQILKEVKNVFQLFTQQFDEHEIYYKQKEDAQNLIKQSVKLSLVAISLKMKAPNKKYEVKCGVKYPEIILQ